MSRTVWLNGRTVEPADARVSAFDAGLQHSVGLFETMLAQATDAAPDGRVFKLAEHLARLERSAKALALMSTLNTRALAEAVEQVVASSGLCTHGGRARVRLTLTGGDLNLLAAARSPDADAPPSIDPTILIETSPAQVYPNEMFTRGVALTVAHTKANPLNPHEGHKTLNYWWRLRELQQAATRGAGEALVLMVTNHVCGGAVSNLFAVRDGKLLTPIAQGEEQQNAVPSPVLPGVTRNAIIELAGTLGVGCEKRMLTIDDVLDADEVFLTNSSWGVLPVTRVEAKAIGAGGDDGEHSTPTPGDLTTKLREKWNAAMADDV